MCGTCLRRQKQELCLCGTHAVVNDCSMTQIEDNLSFILFYFELLKTLKYLMALGSIFLLGVVEQPDEKESCPTW